MKKQQPLISIVIGPNDLLAIREMLKGYVSYVGHNTQSYNAPQKTQAIHNLQQHLLALDKEGQILPITVGEVELLREALTLFEQTIRRMVSPSPERDDTLQSSKALRMSLERLLPGQRKNLPPQGKRKQRRKQRRYTT